MADIELMDHALTALDHVVQALKNLASYAPGAFGVQNLAKAAEDRIAAARAELNAAAASAAAQIETAQGQEPKPGAKLNEAERAALAVPETPAAEDVVGPQQDHSL